MRFIFEDKFLKNIDEMPIYWRWFFKKLACDCVNFLTANDDASAIFELDQQKDNAIKTVKISVNSECTSAQRYNNSYILRDTISCKQEERKSIYLPPIVDDIVTEVGGSLRDKNMIVFDDSCTCKAQLMRVITSMKRLPQFNCIHTNELNDLSYEVAMVKIAASRKIVSFSKNTQINHWLLSLCKVQKIPFIIFDSETVDSFGMYNVDDFLFNKINTKKYSERLYSYGYFTTTIRVLMNAIKVDIQQNFDSVKTFNYNYATSMLLNELSTKNKQGQTAQ